MTQSALWVTAVGMAALTVAAGMADHRRGKRRHLDRPGWVPWALIQVVAMILAIVAAAIALKR